jgi:RNA polymerase sigma-70 factor (ECF subfamily)
MAELKRVVRRAAHGDEEAAAYLFDTYYTRVYRYALARLAHTADAEDVAAEAFARLLRELERFRWRGAGFEAWLFRIAANLVVDRIRARGREQADEEVPARADGTQSDDPEAAVLRAETSEELGDMLTRLPADQQEVLLLRFAGGLDTHETGAVMGRKANAVRQLQFRALQSLRQMMREEAAT